MGARVGTCACRKTVPSLTFPSAGRGAGTGSWCDIDCGRARAAITLTILCVAPPHGFGLTQVTTTTFQYTADGAPTAVATQVEGQPATTVYLTWDNFVGSNG